VSYVIHVYVLGIELHTEVGADRVYRKGFAPSALQQIGTSRFWMPLPSTQIWERKCQLGHAQIVGGRLSSKSLRVLCGREREHSTLGRSVVELVGGRSKNWIQFFLFSLFSATSFFLAHCGSCAAAAACHRFIKYIANGVGLLLPMGKKGWAAGDR